MNKPSNPQRRIGSPVDRQVKAAVEILVPVMRRFTLDFHPEEAALGEEYSITLEVLQDPEICGSAPFLPLRLTIESGDNTDLISRCFDVIKAGYIAAKGELTFDHEERDGEASERCVHRMHVRWFDAVDPAGQVEEAVTPDL